MEEDRHIRINWDEYFLSQAELVSRRSSCERAYVGAVLVKDKRCIATGYNGGVSELENCDEAGHYFVEGHCIRTIHAEMNALIQCATSTQNCEGATLYVTHFPCPICMKLLLQAGIKRIVYLNDYRNDDFAMSIAKEKGVLLEKGELSNVRN